MSLFMGPVELPSGTLMVGEGTYDKKTKGVTIEMPAVSGQGGTVFAMD